MELEKGMYVRFKEGGIARISNFKPITKYTNYNILCFETISGERLFTNKELKELKVSHTLLGNEEEPCLIEVGDYVNGHKVLEVYEDRIKFGEDGLVLARRSNYDNYYLYFEDIKSIVTKEQFESMSYKVGE